MTEVELYGELRQLIGNPGVDEIPKRQLRSPIQSALDWLASVLKYNIKTDSHAITLTADEQEYPLPIDCAWVDWVEWNATKLEPSSTNNWDTDRVKWRTETSGNPREFAVVGRTVILRPAPSSTAVTTGANLTLRYVAAADKMQRGEFGQLGTMDQQLIALRAAVRWHRTHPTETSDTAIANLKEEITELLPDAVDRARNPISDYYPKVRVKSLRRGGGR